MRKRSPSQLMDLFLSIAEALGITEDRDLAALADAGPESVANWRSGAVKEFKPQKLAAAKRNLTAIATGLREQAGALDAGGALADLAAIEIEEGSSPADLQKQFRERIAYDYTGHRFLYFEPQGALAWESLIKIGYEQDCWLSGAKDCADAWLAPTRDSSGRATGPIARALRLDRRDKPLGVDIVSLGSGEGGKEAIILRCLLAAEAAARQRCTWITLAPVDVSISLLLEAARSARRVLATDDAPHRYRSVLPLSADFEDGPLAFERRLRSARVAPEDGLRLILILGNVLGNLRNEDLFVRQKLWRLARPGDLVWIEVGLKLDPLDADPLFRMTRDQKVTASDANRRLLIEGPYRRLTAARGAAPPNVHTRIWVSEDDDTAQVPGSCNFCHDLVIEDESRMCTMLYSRRYELDGLTAWLEARELEVLGIQRTRDSKGRARVAHLLLRRRRGARAQG